ncbi:hypothetical protein [Alienimonas sp. DA493]|uniref:hypothetical protein n=1 Tax=Alienimonas sp. DA493 TaxID=3373605 RepID=UPI0037552B7E
MRAVPNDPLNEPPPPELAAFFALPAEAPPPDPAALRERAAERRAAQRERDRANLATLYSPEARRAEQARRERLRATLRSGALKNVPPLGAAGPAAGGACRPDLWPPRPKRPPGAAGRRGGVWSRRRFVDLVTRFADRRGADFGVLEFCRWAGVASSTLYRHVDSWPALRVAAGLPPAMTGPDRRAATLAALLRALHLNRDRARPLSGAQLARAAGVSRSVVSAYGGVRHLRELYREWARDGAAERTPPAARRYSF